MKKKIVCLSSGATAQYRLDILRIMALPEGAEIQFRYDTHLIDEELRSKLGSDTLHNSPVLLAYLDLTQPKRIPGVRPVLPCRHAVLMNSEQLGQFTVLRFQLCSFSKCGDLVAFRKHISSKSPEAKDGDYTGAWVFEDDFSKECVESHEMSVWQATIKELARSPDFCSEDFFFRVLGLYRRGKAPAIKPEKGEFQLATSTEYEWKIFHFHPEADEHADDHKPKAVSTVMDVTSASDDIKPVTSPSLAIDSSYDLKSFHFRTGSVTANTFASFTVKFGQVQPTAEGSPSIHPELFLPVKIVPSRFRLMFSVAILTGLLFGQQYIAAISKGGIPHTTSLVLLGLALVTAWIAVYELKKPL